MTQEKVFKESYYVALEKLKARKGEYLWEITLFSFNIGKYEFGMRRDFCWWFNNGYTKQFMWWYVYKD